MVRTFPAGYAQGENNNLLNDLKFAVSTSPRSVSTMLIGTLASNMTFNAPRFQFILNFEDGEEFGSSWAEGKAP